MTPTLPAPISLAGFLMCASDSHNPPDARVRELEAENARLREALQAILNEFDPGENDPVARLAREALEAGER